MTDQKPKTLDIMSQIEGQKMHSKNYYLLRNGAIITLLILLTILAVFSFAAFLSDSSEYWELGSTISNPFFVLFSGFLFELLVFVSILIAIFYVVYRQTDWVLVRHARLLILAIIGLIIVGGGITVYTVNQELLRQPVKEIENNIPYRRGRIDKLETELKKRGRFIGKIISLEENQIQVAGPNSTEVFILEGRYPRLEEGLIVGISFEDKDGNLYVKDIRPLPRQDIQRIKERAPMPRPPKGRD